MKQHKGFTLVEMVLVIVVLGAIAGVTAKVMMAGVDAYSLVMSRRDALDHARVGMDRMVRDLQAIHPIQIFWKTNTHLSYINGFISAAHYERRISNGYPILSRNNQELAGNVSLLDFDYLKANGNNAFWPWDIRRINIELNVQSVGGYGTIFLRTEVFPRGLMYANFQ